MTTIQPETKKDQRPPAVYWSSAYFFVIACLYLWAYWSPFSINILEHVSLTDVIKTAAYPIASVFVFMAIGAVLGEVIVPSSYFPHGGGTNTKAGIFLNRNKSLFAAAYVCGTGIYMILGDVEKWRLVPVLLAIPTCFALKEARVLKTTIISERARSVVLFLVSALPFFAYGLGVLKANDIVTGKSYVYVASEIPNQTASTSNKLDSRPRYIGRAGEQYFLYLPTSRSVLIIPLSESKALELRTHSASAFSQPKLALGASSGTASGTSGERN